ncbi:hypothetical protein BT96DRAFT_939790 [Gymnopus androsaceus JB14]|uniref:DUF6534 domain-containing protein n=1 Tax=Gymnopus androsaceus JB14 TaxID=1447944 RepID=A0A6A4HJJ3_9AGAR|nr:hypothetical protein BT96DRAFT_939790 [Gymnopus androsaceus JB14]
MGQYDDVLGQFFSTILIGTWIGSVLFAIVIREAYYYFKNFRRDSLFLKSYVACVVICDTVSLAADYADVYLNSVTHWGDEAFIKKQYWPVGLYLATTGVTAVLVQSFMAARYFTLTRNWIIVSVLFVFILCALGTAEATATVLTIYADYSERYKGRIPVIMWMTTTTVADIAISIALIMQLYTMKTSFSATESLIKRLIRQSIQTGSATSIVAFCVLISFLVNTASNRRIYVLTLLANVNMRKSSSKDDITTNTDDDKRTGRVNPTVTIDGIQVHRTIVHMDDDFHQANPTTVSYKTSNPLSPGSDSNSNVDAESIKKGEYDV